MDVCATDVLLAPAERIWRLFTDPRQLAQWTGTKLVEGLACPMSAGDHLAFRAGGLRIEDSWPADKRWRRSWLSHLADRLVTDRTGLTGQFDLDLQFIPEGRPRVVSPPGANRQLPNTDSSSIFAALQEQLGLKLESTTGPIDVLVIDRVEHPTED